MQDRTGLVPMRHMAEDGQERKDDHVTLHDSLVMAGIRACRIAEPGSGPGGGLFRGAPLECERKPVLSGPVVGAERVLAGGAADGFFP